LWRQRSFSFLVLVSSRSFHFQFQSFSCGEFVCSEAVLFRMFNRINLGNENGLLPYLEALFLISLHYDAVPSLVESALSLFRCQINLCFSLLIPVYSR
jgi:hypothetical protein